MRDQAYLISAYGRSCTVEVHSAAHADRAYKRSNTGQKLVFVIHTSLPLCIFEPE